MSDPFELWQSNIELFKKIVVMVADSFPFSDNDNSGTRLASCAVWLINHALSSGFNLTEEEKDSFKEFMKEECSFIKELIK